MLATETRRSLKDSAVIFAVLAALVAGIAGTDQDAYLAPALEVFLLLYAAFMGWSLFERERQENAGEYMLSLPISRGRLLLLKILPRLLCASLALLLYLLLHRSWHMPSFLPPADFSILYAGFFLLAIAFSVSLRNFLSAFFIVCLLLVGQALLVRLLDPGRELGSAILQSSLAILAFPLFFILLFHGYDVRPAAHFNRKFMPGLLAISAIIAGCLLLTAPPQWNNLQLTRGGLLLKNSCRRSEIDLAAGRRRLDGCLVALRESADGGVLFAMTRQHLAEGGCIETALVRLDLKTGERKTLYRVAKGWSTAPGYPGEVGAERGGVYSLFLQNAQTEKAMILQVAGENVREIPIAGNFFDADIRYVLYQDGGRLVLYSEPRLYRLDTEGRTSDLANSKSLCVWQDKVLLFEPQGMRLCRVGQELVPLRQWRGNFLKSPRRIGGYESRSAVYHEGQRYFWMDLEKQEELPLPVKSPPYTYQQSGESFYVIFANDGSFTIRQIQDGRERETTWAPGFQPAGIRVSPFGLLAFRRQEVRVYPFGK